MTALPSLRGWWLKTTTFASNPPDPRNRRDIRDGLNSLLSYCPVSTYDTSAAPNRFGTLRALLPVDSWQVGQEVIS